MDPYRLELDEILRFFGGKRLLTQADVIRYTGRSRDYVRESLKVSGSKGITATKLALKLSKM